MAKGNRGPWSEADKTYVHENAGRIDYKEIARHIGRDPLSVRKYVREKCTGTNLKKEALKNAEFRIQESPTWKDLTRQFSKDELEMFLYHWSRMIAQFREDVLPSEELQIVDMIKLEVLMNRALSQQHKNREEIERCERERKDELSKQVMNRDISRISELERTISSLYAAQGEMNGDYRDMLVKKGNILKEMKATRDARIKEIESDKKTFTSMIQGILSNKDERRRIGIEMEKARLAAKAEWIRLSQWHTYEDGVLDKPILDSTNVDDIKDEEINE